MKNRIKIRNILGLVLIIILSSNFFIIPSSSDEIGGTTEILVPSIVQPGDIMLMDCIPGVLPPRDFFYYRPGPYNDHAALYIGNNLFIHAGGGNMQVEIKGLDHFMDYYQDFTFARVISATPAQRNDAVQWAIGQEGRGYQIVTDPTYWAHKCANPDSNDIGAELFYCFELPWAAYKNQDIEIDYNEWLKDFPRFFPITDCIWGNDLIYDDDIGIILEYYNPGNP